MAAIIADAAGEAQREAGLGSFYVDQNMDIPHLLEQSLRAHAVYQRDRDYVIMNVADQMSGKPVPSIVIDSTTNIATPTTSSPSCSAGY